MVFAEGKATEPAYLTHWHRRYRDRVLVKVAEHRHTSPLEIVQTAVQQKREDAREARRGRGAAFSQYWCVFDVDEHPNIPAALELAAKNEINIALSNPCIELWFLLHFADQMAYLTRQDAQRRSKQHLFCDKALTAEALNLLEEKFAQAKERALKLSAKHSGDGSLSYQNPSSDVWRLIDVIVHPRSEGAGCEVGGSGAQAEAGA